MSNKNNLQGVISIANQIRLRFTRIIRPHKTFIIAVVVMLLIAVFAVISENFEGSCHDRASIKTIDEIGGKDARIRFSVDSNSNTINSAFYTYQLAISKHVLRKIDEIEKCTGKTDLDPQIELAFVILIYYYFNRGWNYVISLSAFKIPM